MPTEFLVLFNGGSEMVSTINCKDVYDFIIQIRDCGKFKVGYPIFLGIKNGRALNLDELLLDIPSDSEICVIVGDPKAKDK